MGATMRQQCERIAGAYEHQERQIGALQTVLLDHIRRENSCHVVACAEYRAHPAPWHAEKCGCACEAREAYIERLRAIEAKAFPEMTD